MIWAVCERCGYRYANPRKERVLCPHCNHPIDTPVIRLRAQRGGEARAAALSPERRREIARAAAAARYGRPYVVSEHRQTELAFGASKQADAHSTTPLSVCVLPERSTVSSKQRRYSVPRHQSSPKFRAASEIVGLFRQLFARRHRSGKRAWVDYATLRIQAFRLLKSGYTASEIIDAMRAAWGRAKPERRDNRPINLCPFLYGWLKLGRKKQHEADLRAQQPRLARPPKASPPARHLVAYAQASAHSNPLKAISEILDGYTRALVPLRALAGR